MPSPEISQNIRKRDALARYDINKNTLDRAIAKGALTLHPGGWLKEIDVIRWVQARAKGVPGAAAPAANGATTTPDDAEMNAMIGMPEITKPNSMGLLDDDLLERLTHAHIPLEALSMAKQMADVSSAMTKRVAAQEKQLKTLREAGQVVDVRESTHLLDSTLLELVSWLSSLDVELAPQIARETKIDRKKVVAVLRALRKPGLEKMKALADQAADRAEAFMDSKVAEIKRRGGV